MKGFHPTPAPIVDQMVDSLFQRRRPSRSDFVLDPGCGHGAFIDGVLRWCDRNHAPCPTIVGVEANPAFVSILQRKYARDPRVVIEYADFLRSMGRRFQYVVGNPPYVAITGLSEEEKKRYRDQFRTACGRFDLYFLFIEQALKCAEEGARLVFITPEKFMYVAAAKPLRQLLSTQRVPSINMMKEDAFPGLVTYPTITTIDVCRSGGPTCVLQRDGQVRSFELPASGESWLPLLAECGSTSRFALESICSRVSAGVATGADSVFVHPRKEIPQALLPLTYPTVAGRQIGPRGIREDNELLMLVPYSSAGELLSPRELGPALSFLNAGNRRAKLLGRTCVKRKSSPKPWYAFHETPPLAHLLRPKILCKDITPEPVFAIDREGSLIPRHSVYYLVPKDPAVLEELYEFLRSSECRQWLKDNCQRAANGFLRMQSAVLKKLPIPERLYRSMAPDFAQEATKLSLSRVAS